MTERAAASAIRDLQQVVRRLEARSPVRIAPSSAAEAFQFVQAIGGQTLASGHAAITYAASLASLSQLYNPDVDLVYPTGLGNGWLWTNGARAASRVLIRHNYLGYTAPFLAGRRLRVAGTETLTVASGPDIGATMTAYTVTWE